MTSETKATDKPGDPADRAADGAFGGVHSHRAGYGDDKLARLIGWLRNRPDMTLASGEGALLLAEIDWLRARCRQIDDEAYDYAEQIEQLKAAAKDSADHYADARAEIDRLRRILAALREPSETVVENACLALFGAYWSRDDPGDVVWRADARQRFITQLCAAVAAAEQEVEG